VHDNRLLEVLERSRSLGLLGPGSVAVQVDHADGFAAGVDAAPNRFLDLGSGGGVPGLVLALRWPDSQVVLLDARERRCAFLRAAVQDLGFGDRVGVVWARAEEAGRNGDLRAAFDVVVARGFGPPPVTAECGSPFLRVGGTLAVSEPPAGGGRTPGAAAEARWVPTELERLGLRLGRSWGRRYRYQALDQVEPCPAQYPRRPGIPAKRPLF
jgi:16S rRNA (guanine527-N7)-methyltransferase